MLSEQRESSKSSGRRRTFYSYSNAPHKVLPPILLSVPLASAGFSPALPCPRYFLLFQLISRLGFRYEGESYDSGHGNVSERVELWDWRIGGCGARAGQAGREVNLIENKLQSIFDQTEMNDLRTFLIGMTQDDPIYRLADISPPASSNLTLPYAT